MGLDITAYRGLKKAEDTIDEWDYIHLYQHPSFFGRMDEFDPEAVYECEEEYGFRAGSYGGYSEWRSQLADMVGFVAGRSGKWNVPEAGPFVELIYFSDCEGTLGTAVCAKLAKDFAQFQEQADAHGDEYFTVRYNNWRKACEMAADRGAICFH